MTARPKYVAKAETGQGWRIWNRKTKRFWGNYFPEYPARVLDELNGQARPDRLTELCRKAKPKRK